jgi:hypothetical protein
LLILSAAGCFPTFLGIHFRRLQEFCMSRVSLILLLLCLALIPWIHAADLAEHAVSVELYEGVKAEAKWPAELPPATCRYSQPSLAFVGVPKKYTSTGVIDDRSNPFVVRATCQFEVNDQSTGDFRFLLRSKGAVRLLIDGQLVAQTIFLKHNADGHEEVPPLPATNDESLRPLPPGCQEQLAAVKLDPGKHNIQLDAFVGGKGLRLELDEVCVAVARKGEPWSLLAPGQSIPLTEESWLAHAESLRADLTTFDRQTRHNASAQWRDYWNRRHEFARHLISNQTAVVPSVEDVPVHNDIDRFIGAKLAQANAKPAPLTDDFAFLRRVSLDATGVVPTANEISQFLALEPQQRRAATIDRLLADERWADHWVSYWQDALAENPGILKPELNNTGPFRWWIYESLIDNKPFDQFATELVLMQGSTYYGGAAGFGLATQNDVPMAAKAHVLAKAFLAMDMTCARCHDAPYHPFKQQDLFGMAAMLNRKPIKLPATSTVPVVPGGHVPLVKISLKPGQAITPNWGFHGQAAQPLPEDLIRDPADLREQLAMDLTSPYNERFAKVLVNRIWARLMGRGLVEPVDDWEATSGRASHPELLEYLVREFVSNGYDVKHIAGLILNSHAYQRQIIGGKGGKTAPPAELFASPVRRRMTAEQIVDSLFLVSGKTFHSEMLTLDPEGRRPVDSFLNLGTPSRAWQFTSLSNERDRPALALPVSQSIVDLLVAFGWRDSRQNPITYREQEPNALQPLTLANGIAGTRAVRLSDDHVLTQLSLEDQPLDQLVERLFLQILSRPPSDDERDMIVGMLADGYELRRNAEVPVVAKKKEQRNAVSWSNHLSAEATRIKQELERKVQAGDPPTSRLQSQWRERMEDVVWAMINSPEFVFVP